MVPNNDKDRTYAVSYVPKVAGLHKVSPYRPPVFPIPFTSLALAEWTPVSARTPPHPRAPATRLPPSLALLCSSTPSQSCSPLKAYLWPLTPR